MRTEWNTFKGGVWQREINVRDFIQKNYTPYDGNDQFLEGPTENTTELWDQVMETLMPMARAASRSTLSYPTP